MEQIEKRQIMQHNSDDSTQQLFDGRRNESRIIYFVHDSGRLGGCRLRLTHKLLLFRWLENWHSRTVI